MVGSPLRRHGCFSCGDALPQLIYARCWRCSLAWRLACRPPPPGAPRPPARAPRPPPGGGGARGGRGPRRAERPPPVAPASRGRVWHSVRPAARPRQAGRAGRGATAERPPHLPRARRSGTQARTVEGRVRGERIACCSPVAIHWTVDRNRAFMDRCEHDDRRARRRTRRRGRSST